MNQEDWMEFENLPRFKDKTFKPSKLSPTIGYKRDGITTEMLNEPQLLYRYVYGSSSSGMLIYIFNVHVPVRLRPMPISSIIMRKKHDPKNFSNHVLNHNHG